MFHLHDNIAFTFNDLIIRFIPERFELGTTLSQPNLSISLRLSTFFSRTKKENAGHTNWNKAIVPFIQLLIILSPVARHETPPPQKKKIKNKNQHVLYNGCYGILVKRKNISAIAVEILQENTKHYELDSYRLVPRAFLRREEGGPVTSKSKTSLGHAYKCPAPPPPLKKKV